MDIAPFIEFMLDKILRTLKKNKENTQKTKLRKPLFRGGFFYAFFLRFATFDNYARLLYTVRSAIFGL